MDERERLQARIDLESKLLQVAPGALRRLLDIVAKGNNRDARMAAATILQMTRYFCVPDAEDREKERLAVEISFPELLALAEGRTLPRRQTPEGGQVDE